MITLLSQAALACGGLMCDAGPTPVIQNAERIAFLIDEAAGEVEAHVQIFYEGPPDAFAWVVPVAAEPEVFLSTAALFDQVAVTLAPQVQLVRTTEGTCRGESNFRLPGCGYDAVLMADSDWRGADTATPGVEVVSEGSVGPYDHAVLRADGEAELVAWLQDNDYAVPDGLSAALAPYMVEGGHFVAVRLQKDRDTGDIAPLGLRYAADRASIPIQLTALATAPDLRLEVSVFGAHRAVPSTYLHVAINEANLDWFAGGQNYYDVVARAADQAGGHAFATDYAGPTDALLPLWSGLQESRVGRMQDTTDLGEWANELDNLGLIADAAAVAAVAPWATLEVGDALTIRPSALTPEDLPLALEALETFVFEPRRRANRLLEQPWVSRLSSSLDAAEMTVDPVFVTNPDLEGVSNVYTATLVTDCKGNSRTREASPRRLELADGRIYALPSVDETPDDSALWTSKNSDIEAMRIEVTGPRGLPEIVVDLTEDLRREADGSGPSCGCHTAPMGSFALLAVTALGIARRRRDT